MFEEIELDLKEDVTAVGYSDNNYNNLENKPQINNVELSGNKTLEELGIQAKGDYVKKAELPTKTSELINDSGFITNIPEEYKTKTENDEYYQPIGNYPTEEDIDKKGFLGIGALEFKEPNEIFPFYNYWIYSGECGSFNDIYFNNEPIEIIWDGTSYILEPDKEQYSSDWGNLEDYPCYFSLSMERIITNDTSKYHKVIVKDIRGNVLIGKQLSSDYIDLPTIPTNTSELTNDSGFLTEHQDLTNYATTEFVNTQITNAIGGALNGTY